MIYRYTLETCDLLLYGGEWHPIPHTPLCQQTIDIIRNSGVLRFTLRYCIAMSF